MRKREGNVIPLYEPGDIIQLDPDKDPVFGGCFLQITEVRDWGVIGFFPIPDANGPKRAWYRAKYSNISRIGAGEWVALEEVEWDTSEDDDEDYEEDE